MLKRACDDGNLDVAIALLDAGAVLYFPLTVSNHTYLKTPLLHNIVTVV